jgi:hypothetical protein
LQKHQNAINFESLGSPFYAGRADACGKAAKGILKLQRWEPLPLGPSQFDS